MRVTEARQQAKRNTSLGRGLGGLERASYALVGSRWKNKICGPLCCPGGTELRGKRAASATERQAQRGGAPQSRARRIRARA